MADDRKTDEAGTAPDPAGNAGDRQPQAPEHATTGPGGGQAPDPLAATPEPGRPIGRDEIDPELVILPRTRTHIGPVLSISIIVFCIFIMFRLRADLRFSLQDETPRVFESAAALLSSEDLADRFVQVRAVPDRALAVHVAASLAEPGSRLTPVQGTNETLWLMLDGSVWTAGIQYDEVYTGRVRRLSVLPFDHKLRRHVDERPPAPRFAQPAAVRAALEAGAARVKDPAGDDIAVAADTPAHVYQAAGDLVRIVVMAGEHRPTAEAWTEALAAAGLVAPGAAPAAGERDDWIYTATVPGGVETARTRLEQARLPGARVEPIQVVHELPWRDLAARDDALVVGGRRVPWEQVEWISLTVPRQVPEQVWVLLTDEQPQAYWYVSPLFVALGLFGLLFSWALVRTLRWREEPDPLPFPPSTT